MKAEITTLWTVAFVIILASLVFFSQIVMAEPEGAQVVYMSNSTKNATTPGSRADPKGTITTINLNTVQQNIKWKAYVGNVSGTLVLRDAESYSIYEWGAAGDPDGEVYMTMNSTIDWSTIQCANETEILTQQAALGHSLTAVDNINKTFSSKIHRNFDVGTQPIGASTCKSAFPWINNTAQTPSLNALYPEVLLMDLSSRLVFTSLIDQNKVGYRNDSTKYDFQAIIPDYTVSTIATYYFYVEISG